MRSEAVLAAVAMLAAGILAPVAGMAESDPSAAQIVKSLTPTGLTGPTRGIRVAPGATGPVQPPAPAPTISLSVQFATGSADLTSEAVRVLDNLGKALNDQTLAAFRFRIEGHTDTVGTHEYNQELSDRRAAAVLDFLAANFHVDRSRVQAVGMGEDHLLIPTPDQTAEPRNRRVQVVNIGS
ncbi:MAG TPA: OmpA family protein [Acetobacteraceae bacterium]|jgi:outer membrane protein OmpA-like peptidoglycan-associated protein